MSPLNATMPPLVTTQVCIICLAMGFQSPLRASGGSLWFPRKSTKRNKCSQRNSWRGFVSTGWLRGRPGGQIQLKEWKGNVLYDEFHRNAFSRSLRTDGNKAYLRVDAGAVIRAAITNRGPYKPNPTLNQHRHLRCAQTEERPKPTNSLADSRFC